MSLSGEYQNRPDSPPSTTRKPQLSLSAILLSKRETKPSTPKATTSWERETTNNPLAYSELSYTLPSSSSSDQSFTLPNGTTINKHSFPDNSEIVIKERMDFIGTRIWDCSVYCAKMFEYHSLIASTQSNATPNPLPWGQYDLRDSSILELGSGCGLTAIALSSLVGDNGVIVATEYGSITSHLNACVIDNLSDKGKVNVQNLDWFSQSDTDNVSALGPFNIILMSDCTLNAKEVPLILSIFEKFMKQSDSGVRGIVGLCRERDGTPLFLELAHGMFDIKRVDIRKEGMWGAHPVYESKRLEVWEMRIKA